jgi:hypothetical protein
MNACERHGDFVQVALRKCSRLLVTARLLVHARFILTSTAFAGLADDHFNGHSSVNIHEVMSFFVWGMMLGMYITWQ